MTRKVVYICDICDKEVSANWRIRVSWENQQANTRGLDTLLEYKDLCEDCREKLVTRLREVTAKFVFDSKKEILK